MKEREREKVRERAKKRESQREREKVSHSIGKPSSNTSFAQRDILALGKSTKGFNYFTPEIDHFF